MKKIILSISILIIFATTGCQKMQMEQNTNLLIPQNTNNQITNFTGNRDIILGSKLQNPYTVSNIKKAYVFLLSKGYKNNINIRTTHYYIKFKPQNFEQYEKLVSDTNLIVFDYPLDYEIVQYGNRYHDPNLPDSVPTFQYCSIKIDYKFNQEIPYEIIDELYIPEEDTDLKNRLSNNFINELLKQAYIQTNNFSDTIGLTTYNLKSSQYTPSGNIGVYDTRIGKYIGLEGIEVRANRWFTTYRGITESDGDFTVNGSFSNPCNYSIWFNDDKFVVREHLIGQTYHIEGPKIIGAWNYQIANNYEKFAATIFRAAYRYHHKNKDGLQRPYRPSGLRTIYVGVDGITDNSGVNWIVLPDIRIGRYYYNINQGITKEYTSDEVFSTTIHETAHTSHVIVMNAGVIQYSQVSSLLQESWAIGIEWWITKLEYKNQWNIQNYGDWNYSVSVQYPNQYAYQYWNKSISSNYTNLFINLIDNYNECLFYVNGANDQITGYTFAGIEQKILKHSYGLSSLATNLKTFKPSGVTDTQIDTLLKYY